MIVFAKLFIRLQSTASMSMSCDISCLLSKTGLRSSTLASRRLVPYRPRPPYPPCPCRPRPETSQNQGSRALLSNHIASRPYRWFVPGCFLFVIPTSAPLQSQQIPQTNLSIILQHNAQLQSARAGQRVRRKRRRRG